MYFQASLSRPTVNAASPTVLQFNLSGIGREGFELGNCQFQILLVRYNQEPGHPSTTLPPDNGCPWALRITILGHPFPIIFQSNSGDPRISSHFTHFMPVYPGALGVLVFWIPAPRLHHISI